MLALLPAVLAVWRMLAACWRAHLARMLAAALIVTWRPSGANISRTLKIYYRSITDVWRMLAAVWRMLARMLAACWRPSGGMLARIPGGRLAAVWRAPNCGRGRASIVVVLQH
jgi:hypothetical protein